MKRLLQWIRANAAVIAAASALSALGGPSVREAATVIGAVADALVVRTDAAEASDLTPKKRSEEGVQDGVH